MSDSTTRPELLRLLSTAAALIIASLSALAVLALSGGRFESVGRPATSDEESPRQIEALRRQLEQQAPSGTYAVIDTYSNRLRVLKRGALLREATCSTGSGLVLRDTQNGREWIFDTPLGERRVERRTRNPVWIKPDWAFVEEGFAPPTEARERIDDVSLGDYGIYLGDGYLIHGTLSRLYWERRSLTDAYGSEMTTSSISIATWLSALAFFSSSLAAAGDGERKTAPASALRQEIDLARRPEVYLVVDVVEGVVEVKARGMVLASIAAVDAEVLRYRRFGTAASEEELLLPAVRTVVASDIDKRRPVIVTKELRPYPVDSTADLGTAPADESQPVSQPPTEPGAPPTRYRAQLDEGWEIWIGQGPPGPGRWARAAQAVSDGWKRWRGMKPAPRVVLGLALDPEDARRLHHLLRPGARLLVF